MDTPDYERRHKTMNEFEDYLTVEQSTLFKTLQNKYKDNIVSISNNDYILVKGDAPILLVAHLDTVHLDVVDVICKTDDGNILMSPQGIGGDDRCGVYALDTIYERSGIKPWLLFTCDEEVGCIGAKQLCLRHRKNILPQELRHLKLIIEIDYPGKSKAVYYNCNNINLEAYITKMGFNTEHGTYSDITFIAPELGVATVNLSAGYYNAHTQHEYINRSHLDDTIQKVVKIVNESNKPDFPTYKYIEKNCANPYTF